MEHTAFLILIIMVLSVVQGLFGVGILIFGTPIFILLGHSFESTLAILLPSSIVISLIQTIRGRHQIKLAREFLVFSIPFLLIGLVMVLLRTIRLDMKILVGSILIASALLRMSDTAKSRLEGFLKQNTRIYLAVMGLVHGLSNMGGALLTILSTSLFDNKRSILSNIAFCYLVFGSSQLAVLAVMHPAVFSPVQVLSAFASLATYLAVGKFIYQNTSERRYQFLIPVIMLSFGIALIGSNLLIK